MVAQHGQAVNFRDRSSQAFGLGLETDHVIHTTRRKAVEVARNAGRVVIEQRGHIDELVNLAGEQL